MCLTKELPSMYRNTLSASHIAFVLGFESTPSIARRFDSLTFLNSLDMNAIMDCSEGMSYLPRYQFCGLSCIRLALIFFPLSSLPSSNQPFKSTTNRSIVFFPRVFPQPGRFAHPILCAADIFVVSDIFINSTAGCLSFCGRMGINWCR